MILTAAERKALTGYVRKHDQIRWLRTNGFRFTVNGLGEPIIAVAEFNRRMVGGRSAQQEPNFEALHGTHATN